VPVPDVPSIVIPAHDEEHTLRRCLATMTRGMKDGELAIVVVANGCRDATAAVAREFAPAVRVVETEVASKIHALNLGDQVSTGFPRFYVDADVLLPIESIRRVAQVLSEERYLAAAPRLRVALEGRPWPVRAYYEIWTRLPYFREGGMIGSGVYAVSREGRSRFERFPEIVSDDGYVRLQFSPEERTTVQDCEFTIAPPKSLAGVIRIKTRSQRGANELLRVFPLLGDNERRDYPSVLGEVLKSPRMWPAFLVYCFVKLVTWGKAYWQYHSRRSVAWERDEESRLEALAQSELGRKR